DHSRTTGARIRGRPWHARPLCEQDTMMERRRDLPPGAGAPGFILGARNRQSDGGGLRGAAPGGAALAALRCCDRTLARPPCTLAPLPGLVPSRAATGSTRPIAAAPLRLRREAPVPAAKTVLCSGPRYIVQSGTEKNRDVIKGGHDR